MLDKNSPNKTISSFCKKTQLQKQIWTNKEVNFIITFAENVKESLKSFKFYSYIDQIDINIYSKQTLSKSNVLS